ncbi:AAA+-type ATPase [Coemansia sp. RSA 1807]|nr:AAA+-type ATPase [Coemansia sp. RSA 551]KAJ2575702.1 AAA+-type ATPase [Coemansia sp. RSA 1807]
MKVLAGKTVFITGGTRGIGRAIALKCAESGARVAVVARQADNSAIVGEIQAAGGQGIAIACDIRDEEQVKAAVAKTVGEFGGIDVLVNNATTLVLKTTSDISMDEYDTMAGINSRGTFLVVKHVLPYLQQSNNAHILTMCPKPQLDQRWFGSNLAYTMSKFSMGLLAFGLAAEQRPHGIASNALWPFTTIDTDGLAECGNAQFQARPRSPAIIADAALWIITQDSESFSGNFCIDEIVLREAGVCDFEKYSTVPGTPLADLSQDHMIAPEQMAKLVDLRQQQSETHNTETSNPRRVLLDVVSMDDGGLVAGDIVRLSLSEREGPAAFGTAWPSILCNHGEMQLTETAMLNCQAKAGDRMRVERVTSSPLEAQRIAVSFTAPYPAHELPSTYAKGVLSEAGCVWLGQLVDVNIGGALRRLRVRSVRLATTGAELQIGKCALATPELLQVEIVDDVSYSVNTQRHVDYDSIGGLEREIGEVRRLVEAALNEPELFLDYGLQPPRGVLLYGPPGTGKTLIARAVAQASGAEVHVINGAEVMSKYYGESEARLREIFTQARQHSPSIVFIDEIDALCPKRGDSESEAGKRVVATLLTLMDGAGEHSGDRVVVLGATNRPGAIDAALRRPGRFDREIEIPIPSQIGRRHILEKKLVVMPNTLTSAHMDAVAAATHGFVGADIDALLREAAIVAIKSRAASDLQLPVITNADVVAAMKVVRPSTMREVTLEIPCVRWSDIGGQHDTKQQLRESVEWPLKHATAFERMGIRPPKGILLYGPPGCSKTLTAKALATEAGLNFIAVRGPELLSKWVGESEKAVREVFRKARAAAPSIVFFDEIDALAVKRGASGDGTSVADRVLSQLLTELDGIEPLVSVTVVAATNRPDVIDPAILRPDRIDRQLYIGPPNAAAREEILRLQLAKIAAASDVDIADLTHRSAGFSGAEVVALCQEAAIEAMNADPDAQCVEMVHFNACLSRFKTRITPEMLQFYADFQTQRKAF